MADDVASPDELGESAGDNIVRHDFATGFRGFDPGEVTAHLERVAAQVRQLEEALASARSAAAAAAAVAAAAESSPAPAPSAPNPLDEVVIMEALGAEAGNILRQAH